MHDSCVQLYWVLDQLCRAMRSGTLLVVLDACRVVDRDAIPASEAVHAEKVGFHPRCVHKPASVLVRLTNASLRRAA